MKEGIKRIFRLPYLVLVLAPFGLMAPVFLSGQALFWGTPAAQFVPWWSWAWETLRGGHLPLWNPLLGMGAPLLANYQSGLLYPPNWLYLILAAIGGTPALAWGMSLLVAAHLAWAAIGMALLAQRLGLGVLAQIISGLAFSLSGYLVARAGFLSINASVAWVPWVILGVTSLGGVVPKLYCLSFCVGLQLLAGHAQTSWYTLLLAGMWAILWGMVNSPPNPQPEGGKHGWWRGRIAHRQSFVHLGRAIFLFAAAVGIGFALSAAQLLPTAEYLQQSQRASAVDYELAMTYSFWPWRFLTLLAPNLFGNPVNGDYWGYANYWEDAVYVGLLPIIMSVYAIINTGKRKKGQSPEISRKLSLTNDQAIVGSSFIDRHSTALVYFLLGIFGFSFLLALGKNTPVFPWLYRYVPTFAMFQAPSRISLLGVFALALLAGIGVETWRRPKGRSLYWARLGTAAAAAIALGAGVAALGAQSYLVEIKPSFIRATALAGFWGVGVGILTLTAPRTSLVANTENKPGKWSLAVITLVVTDLLVAGWGLNPRVDLDFYNKPSPAAEEVRIKAEGARLYLSNRTERAIKYDKLFRFDTFYPPLSEGGWRILRAVMLPNINLLEGIPSANNFDPLVPGRYARWMEELAKADPELRERLLNLMNVSVVEEMDASKPYGVRYDVRPTLPRVRWISCARSARSSSEALELVLSSKADFDRVTVLETREVSQITNCPGESPAELNIISENPNHLEVQIEAAVNGYLLVADVWYPRWVAWVDGQPTRILRANYLFRAVEVPAGKHNVVFTYQPITFYLGAFVSGLAWLVVGLFIYRRRRDS